MTKKFCNVLPSSAHDVISVFTDFPDRDITQYPTNSVQAKAVPQFTDGQSGDITRKVVGENCSSPGTTGPGNVHERKIEQPCLLSAQQRLC